jgi:hypothetical protein
VDIGVVGIQRQRLLEVSFGANEVAFLKSDDTENMLGLPIIGLESGHFFERLLGLWELTLSVSGLGSFKSDDELPGVGPFLGIRLFRMADAYARSQQNENKNAKTSVQKFSL